MRTKGAISKVGGVLDVTRLLRGRIRGAAFNLFLVGMIAFPISYASAQIPNGNVMASTCSGVTEYTPTGTLVMQLAARETAGSMFDSSGNFYVTDFSAQAVTKFDPSGVLIGPFGGPYNADPESVIHDTVGDVFVGQADGTHAVLKFNSGGTLLATFTPATEFRGTDWIELAADQCTLFYTSEDVHVKRFNVCTNTQLADFNPVALPGDAAYAHRLLPAGGMLVADTSTVVRLDASGNQIQTYPALPTGGTLFALNLDPDGTSFWTGNLDSGEVFRVDIVSGSILTHWSTAGAPGFPCSESLSGLTIKGEIIVSAVPTSLTFTAGPRAADFDDSIQVQALLTVAASGSPVPNKLVTFMLGSGAGTETCSATTNALGMATCAIKPNQAAGAYTLKASFAGDASDAASSSSVAFSITHEETVTALTSSSATVIANGHPATLSATLKEDGTTLLVGKTITFKLGADGTAQTCTGTTNSSGLATCTIPAVNQPLGPNTVSASFAGDAFYSPSSASESVIAFQFLASGSMVIGDLDGAAVEFWGDDWAPVNVLTGGPAPDAFKGFAATTTEPPACGSTWLTRPGNSSDPPDPPLPAYMGVVVSSMVGKFGPAIAGNVREIVVVRTNPGYEANPGHHGTGTVVAVYCK